MKYFYIPSNLQSTLGLSFEIRLLPRTFCLKIFHEAKKVKIWDLLKSWEIVIMLNALLFLPWIGSLGNILIGELGEAQSHEPSYHLMLRWLWAK